jgi:UTP--glucose-1-phosphate uridylyltransferase
MRVETGVIAAAGSGTRMLPVTLGYPKELLPIINKPAIHLIIEEFIDSGPYGNGTPLIVARKHIPENQGFIYAYGDDLIKSATPFARRLIEKHNKTGALVVGTQEVPWEDVVRYGIAQIKEDSPDGELDDVVEKPSREEARSNLAMFGRFLLSPEVIQILTEIPKGKANELWLTDAVREYIRRGGKVVSESVVDGKWLTIGDPVNYLTTVVEYALSDDELRDALEPRLRALLKY